MRGGLRAGRRQAAGDRGARRVQGRWRVTAGWGAVRGEQCTENMKYVSVTLEVSQLRSWLKAFAFCQGSQAEHTVRGGRRAGEAAL